MYLFYRLSDLVKLENPPPMAVPHIAGWFGTKEGRPDRIGIFPTNKLMKYTATVYFIIFVFR